MLLSCASKMVVQARLALLLVLLLLAPGRSLLAAEMQPLPAPLKMPKGSPEQRAATLATQALAGGKDALPALLAAIKASGLGVREPDGPVLIKPDRPSQGLAFDPLEVHAMARLVEKRIEVPLQSISALLSIASPQLKEATLDALLLQDIQADANDKAETVRFWAYFIVELGRQGSEPYDLLGRVNLAEIRLNGIQAAFIWRRLTAELYVAAQAEKAATRSQASTEAHGNHPGFVAVRATSSPTLSPSYLQPASVTADLPENPRFWTIASEGPAPCTFNSTQETILDIEALGSKALLRKLLNYLKENMGEVAQKSIAAYQRIIGVVNIAFAYAKLAMIYTFLKVEISMNNPPLVRYRESKRGEMRVLTARVSQDVDPEDLQMINCLRQVLHAAGSNFKVQQSGALEDVEVGWALKPFTVNPIVELEPVKHSTLTRTDANGVATIEVWGTARKYGVSSKAIQVTKQQRVEVRVVPESSGILKDFWDVIKTAIGLFIGGPKGLLTIPADLLKRTTLLSTYIYTFPVKDWENDLPITMKITSRASRYHLATGTLQGRLLLIDPNAEEGKRRYKGTLTIDCKFAERGWGWHTSQPVEVTAHEDGDWLYLNLGFKGEPNPIIELPGTSFQYDIHKGVSNPPRVFKNVPAEPIPDYWAENGSLWFGITGGTRIKEPRPQKLKRPVGTRDTEHQSVTVRWPEGKPDDMCDWDVTFSAPE
jgi:hypothetical protein